MWHSKTYQKEEDNTWGIWATYWRGLACLTDNWQSWISNTEQNIRNPKINFSLQKSIKSNQKQSKIETLSNWRVSEAMRPLLGKPKRISERWMEFKSAFPFTKPIEVGNGDGVGDVWVWQHA